MRVANFIGIKSKVKEILEGALSDFTVTWGFTKRDVPRKWCYIGRLHWPEGEWATNRSREYTVTVPVVLNAILARKTPEEGETWLAAQVDAVIAGFEADSDLRSLGVITWNLVPRDFGSQPHPDGLEVQTALELAVTYR